MNRYDAARLLRQEKNEETVMKKNQNPQILIDTYQLQHNPDAMRQIEAINAHYAHAAYNNVPNINTDRYAAEQARRLEDVVKKFAVTCKTAKIYDNGIKYFVYLDAQGRIVTTLHGVTPAFGFGLADQ